MNIAALRTFRSLAISSRSASIVRAVLNVKVDVDADEEVTNLMAVFTRVPACPEIVMRMYMAAYLAAVGCRKEASVVV